MSCYATLRSSSAIPVWITNGWMAMGAFLMRQCQLPREHLLVRQHAADRNCRAITVRPFAHSRSIRFNSAGRLF